MSKQIPQGYKQTKLGIIPEDWKVVKLGTLTTKIGSGITPMGGESVYQNTGRHFIRSQNIGYGNLRLEDVAFISDEIHSTFQNTEIKINDILLNITGASIGRCAIANGIIQGGNVNQHVCIIRTKDNLVNARHLTIFLLSYQGQKQVESFQAGGNRQGLNFAQISSFLILLPPIKEQEKIAEILTTWDDAIAKQEQLIEQKQVFKKGLMQQIFSQKRRFKDDNGNDYPVWQEQRLGEIFTHEKGNGISKDELTQEGINKCILYGELYTTYNEVVNLIKSRTNSYNGLISCSGDLLIPASTTTTGIDLANVTALNEVGVLLGGDITVLRAKRQVHNIFYAYYLSNYKKHQIAKYAQGITIVHLYFSHLKNMVIDMSAYDEQVKIADFLTLIDDGITKLSEELEQLKLQKKCLMQKLLTGQVRVRIL